jgi:hypothetical protein
VGVGSGSDAAWLHVNKQARIILSNQQAWTWILQAGEWLGGVLIVKVAVYYTLWKECWKVRAGAMGRYSGCRYKRELGAIQIRTPHISIADCVFRRVAVR